MTGVIATRRRARRWRSLERRAAQIDAAWFHPDRQLPYAFARELASWPQPIDVIRFALGLISRPRPKKLSIRWVKGMPIVEYIDDPDWEVTSW